MYQKSCAKVQFVYCLPKKTAGSSLLTLTVTPAPFACSAKTCAAATAPLPMASDVLRVTVRLS